MSKILLVEDDNNLREIYEARLQAEGYEIVSARDGEEALTVAMKERPDLIISDVMMPKISGFDMLDIIRSTEETKDVKVIMMTALSQAEDKERATKLGADRYLVKSQVTLEDVAKVAREVLEGASDQNPTAAYKPPTATPPAITQAPVTPAVTTVPTTPAPIEPEVLVAAPVVATQKAPTSEPIGPPMPMPVTEASAFPAPIVPEPATTSQIDTESNTSPALAAISPTAPDQITEEEESAIAAQIESFIEVKKTEENTIPSESAPAQETETEAEQTPVVADASEKKVKKIIQPISDPTESKGPDLENLLKKEEEKDQMAEIAKTLVDQKAYDASTGAVVAAETTGGTVPQVDIVQNEALKVEPAPIETNSVTTGDVTNNVNNPIIPHSNGSNMDGVVAPLDVQPQPTEPQPDTAIPETPVSPPVAEVSKSDPNLISL